MPELRAREDGMDARSDARRTLKHRRHDDEEPKHGKTDGKERAESSHGASYNGAFWICAGRPCNF